MKITGYYNDELLSNVPEQELIEKGIILECEYYYIKDSKKLTPKEFFNNEYNSNSRLNYMPNTDKCYYVTFNGDGDMEVYFSSKTYLPTINEKFENQRSR